MADNTTDTAQIDTSNSIFKKAVAFVTDTEENLFLTGKAGTGKTTFLRYIRTQTAKNCAVVAPTGVAAMNAGGETIHSFLQLPFGPFVPGNGGGFGRKTEGTQDKHSLLANLRLREQKIKLLRKLDILIIDEVSMVRADLMDSIDLVLRHVRNNYLQPFGGVQMIFIGDAFQLPPVVNEEDWQILREYYTGTYFFDSQVLTEHPPVYIELKKIYRQKEQAFIDILNRVRNGSVTDADIVKLNERYIPDAAKEDGRIMLCTHNHIADDINQRELAALDKRQYSFDGKTEGEINPKNLQAEQTLQLKEGAQVMFIKNDLQTPRRYYNGKTGIVSTLNKDEIWVSFPGSGDEIKVPLESWRSVRYTLNKQAGKIEEEEMGSFTQYPLRLAWAVTIHKSQGLTLDKATLDINRSFAPGQVYVALSRCTILTGIILRSPMHIDNVMVDKSVISFSENEPEEEELSAVLKEGMLKAQSQRMQRVFSFVDMIVFIGKQRAELMKRKTGPKEEGVALLDTLLKRLTEAQKHGNSFGRQLHDIVMSGDEELLKTRTEAAVTYFTEKVLNPCLPFIDNHLNVLDTYQRVIKISKIWKNIKIEIEAKVTELKGLL